MITESRATYLGDRTTAGSCNMAYREGLNYGGRIIGFVIYVGTNRLCLQQDSQNIPVQYQATEKI